MTDDSRFFTGSRQSAPQNGDELIYSSARGWSEIRRIDRDGKFLACKSLKEEFRGKARYESLLRKEYSISYPLSHSSIREVYGFENIPPYGNCIVMEYIDGIPLEEFIRSARPSARLARDLALQLCDALAYLHSKQILHRDVKPSNILITHNGNYLKLIDFSLADSDSSAIHKAPAGTPSFAAPEVLAGEPSDTKADIWSFGKILSLLLPSEKRLIRRCTAPKAGDRPSSFSEIRKDLQKGSSPLLRILLSAAAAATLAAAILAGIRTPAPDRPESEATVTDTLAIDEIFRQATEMVDGRSGQ